MTRVQFFLVKKILKCFKIYAVTKLRKYINTGLYGEKTALIIRRLFLN